MWTKDLYRLGQETTGHHWKRQQQDRRVSPGNDSSVIRQDVLSCCQKRCNADLLEHGDNIPNKFHKDTKWHQSLATHVGMALPNIFLINFGQNIPFSPIMPDKTKLAFDRLGSSYEAWRIMAGVALK